MRASDALLGQNDIARALGSEAQVEEDRSPTPSALGQVLQAAAIDSAYRRFSGRYGPEPTPFAVAELALVFDSAATAAKTFDHVAEAAHLRMHMEGADVAVETVTAANGMVSYWGYVHLGAIITVLTVDSLDPQQVSIASLRALVTQAVGRLEAAKG